MLTDLIARVLCSGSLAELEATGFFHVIDMAADLPDPCSSWELVGNYCARDFVAYAWGVLLRGGWRIDPL